MSTRPPLPSALNPHLNAICTRTVIGHDKSQYLHSDTEVPQVKFQILTCQGQDILVGRMKIDTPTTSGHAFILRRYDTGAVSATTMFEQRFLWPQIKKRRRSGKSGGATATPKAAEAPLAATTPFKPVSTNKSRISPVEPPAKRRKAVASPVARSPSPPYRSSPPAPRRSTRTKSPSLRASELPKASRTPRKSTRRDFVIDTPGGSEQTVVDDDGYGLEKVIHSELHSQDIAEQKDLINGLKAQREEALAEEDDIDMEYPSMSKRSREDEKPLKFEPKRQEVESRAIATNRRVSRFHLEPKTKSVAWGVAAFVFGAGAVTLLPNLF
ncbi:hypothetical protein CPB85DRAFT_1510094 [Mucidula mucida]|nr:hypothetical protein CPB85DRAFT_1510094 [Mucidula mucida]